MNNMNKSIKNTLNTLLFVLSFGLLACNTPTDFSADLSRIDSLKMLLDNAELKLSEVNRSEIKFKYSKYKMRLNKIRATFPNKKDPGTWPIIQKYSSIKAPFMFFLKNYDGFVKDIEYSQKQLGNLYEDVENNLLTKKKINNYFKNEATHIEALIKRINEIVKNVQYQNEKYDLLDPKVIEIIEDWKKLK